jgi:hypothetical protein
MRGKLLSTDEILNLKDGVKVIVTAYTGEDIVSEIKWESFLSCANTCICNSKCKQALRFLTPSADGATWSFSLTDKKYMNGRKMLKWKNIKVGKSLR